MAECDTCDNVDKFAVAESFGCIIGVPSYYPHWWGPNLCLPCKEALDSYGNDKHELIGKIEALCEGAEVAMTYLMKAGYVTKEQLDDMRDEVVYKLRQLWRQEATEWVNQKKEKMNGTN